MKKIPNITMDPQICHGKPVIGGTRVMVAQILELLEAGFTEKQIYNSYPTLPDGSVQKALHFAAQKLESDVYFTYDKKTNPHVFVG